MIQNHIHHSAIISDNVRIGKNVIIHPNVIIYEGVEIEDNVIIGANSVIGAPPKTIGAKRGDGSTQLKNSCYIGENCVIDAPIIGNTIIGEHCYLMPFVYIGHDTELMSNVILSSGVKIGGYVIIDKFANLGLNVSVHQFSTIGSYSMIGMGTIVNKDVPPYCRAFGIPIQYKGLNKTGLNRLRFNPLVINKIEMYYQSKTENHDKYNWMNEIENFLKTSKRKKLIFD